MFVCVGVHGMLVIFLERAFVAFAGEIVGERCFLFLCLGSPMIELWLL